VPEKSSHVLNVIAENAEALARALSGFGQPMWLAEGRAFDIPVGNDTSVLNRARKIIGSESVDMNHIPIANRRKSLLVADMDSTIIGCECLDELADMAGLKPQVAAITERAMRGEIDFAPALRERVALLKGLPLSALDRVYRERVRLNPGAKTLVATMRAHGAKTMLVSGGFAYFTERVAAGAGFESQQANVLLDDGEKLLGTVAEPILGREAKLEALEQATRAAGLDFADTLAVGDGANDLAMIGRAGLGVAYHAKPIVAQATSASIAHGDLTALLYLQGYREDEITTV
jgi:phosphoserine phosphatase